MTASKQNIPEDETARTLLGEARALLKNEDERQFFDRLFASLIIHAA